MAVSHCCLGAASGATYMVTKLLECSFVRRAPKCARGCAVVVDRHIAVAADLPRAQAPEDQRDRVLLASRSWWAGCDQHPTLQRELSVEGASRQPCRHWHGRPCYHLHVRASCARLLQHERRCATRLRSYQDLKRECQHVTCGVGSEVIMSWTLLRTIELQAM